MCKTLVNVFYLQQLDLHACITEYSEHTSILVYKSHLGILHCFSSILAETGENCYVIFSNHKRYSSKVKYLYMYGLK